MVGTASQAVLYARAQLCRPRLDCSSSWGGRWLGQCLKRCFVLALNHFALDWPVRDPGEGVGWDGVSSGASCSRSTMPPSIGLCEILGRALVGTVSQAVRSARAQPGRPRMACARSWRVRWLGQCLKRGTGLALNHAAVGRIVRGRWECVDWDCVSSGAFCSRSTMPPSDGFCAPWRGRWLGQCLKRSFLLALNHAALDWPVRDPGEGVSGDSVSSGA